MLVALSSGLAALVAAILPLRWGVIGFLGAALLLFVTMFAVLALRGFEGLPLQESLLLFEGSMTAYLLFNVQVAYRAFAFPALVLGAILTFRNQRERRQFTA